MRDPRRSGCSGALARAAPERERWCRHCRAAYGAPTAGGGGGARVRAENRRNGVSETRARPCRRGSGALTPGRRPRAALGTRRTAGRFAGTAQVVESTTRPALIARREELLARAGDLFTWIAAGVLNVRIGAEFPSEDAADAHSALEGRQTTGPIYGHIVLCD